MFPHKVLGSFADIPAVIRIDDVSFDSTVSLSFLHDRNVPCSIINHDGVAVESAFGPVRVPTVDGWYNSRQTFRSGYLNGCDVKLGCDWLAFVNAKSDGIRFLRPSDLDVARLPDGHNNLSPSSSVISDKEEDLTTQAGLCLAAQAGSSTATQAGSSTITQAGSSLASSPIPSRNEHVVDNFFGGYESLSRSSLSELAVAHGLKVNPNVSMEDLRQAISRHVGTGCCGSHVLQHFEGCESICQGLDMSCGGEDTVLSARIALLTAILTTTK
ncbi:hypothetical protein DFJ58DRAFT_731106 [Suillus subalutaceus]|uniref:uncharacterized protein n=1 Tax=Suillus subalutaceus TaxID=48586 RepID=UPI001B86AD88|nr:uncharacterized protein DFJ58DRAFT_731106 [Suillus subalutaceus]KAG1844838.1 hypothetical protein DFJ58DRAFT_731106 [Suillus subalutaceus]